MLSPKEYEPWRKSNVQIKPMIFPQEEWEGDTPDDGVYLSRHLVETPCLSVPEDWQRYDCRLLFSSKRYDEGPSCT